jgi:hypothetical protein
MFIALLASFALAGQVQDQLPPPSLSDPDTLWVLWDDRGRLCVLPPVNGGPVDVEVRVEFGTESRTTYADRGTNEGAWWIVEPPAIDPKLAALQGTSPAMVLATVTGTTVDDVPVVTAAEPAWVTWLDGRPVFSATQPTDPTRQRFVEDDPDVRWVGAAPLNAPYETVVDAEVAP